MRHRFTQTQPFLQRRAAPPAAHTATTQRPHPCATSSHLAHAPPTTSLPDSHTCGLSMTLTGSHWLAALHTSKGLYTRLKKCLVLINQANGLLLACFPVSCMASSRHSAVCEGTNCPRAARAWQCPIDRLPARVRPTQDRLRPRPSCRASLVESLVEF